MVRRGRSNESGSGSFLVRFLDRSLIRSECSVDSGRSVVDWFYWRCFSILHFMLASLALSLTDVVPGLGDCM